MDQTDRKILAQLTKNARKPVTAIGKEIALSRTAVQDRIRRLEDRGIITGYSVDIASQYDDHVKAMIFVNFSQRPCEPILDWLRTLDNVTRVVSLSGALDCLIEVVFRDTESLSKFSDELSNDARVSSLKTQIILSEKIK